MPAGEFVDYYELFGVESDADIKAIRINYLKLAKSSHPDTGGSTEKMQLINQAYDTLSDYLSRSAYNKLYMLHNAPPEELQYKEDVQYTSSYNQPSSEFADDYVDQAYYEYYSKPVRKKGGTGSFAFMFAVAGALAIALIVFMSGLSALSIFGDNTDTTTPAVSPSTNQSTKKASAQPLVEDTPTNTSEPVTSTDDNTQSLSDDNSATTTPISDSTDAPTTDPVTPAETTNPQQTTTNAQTFQRFWRR